MRKESSMHLPDFINPYGCETFASVVRYGAEDAAMRKDACVSLHVRAEFENSGLFGKVRILPLASSTSRRRSTFFWRTFISQTNRYLVGQVPRIIITITGGRWRTQTIPLKPIVRNGFP